MAKSKPVPFNLANIDNSTSSSHGSSTSAGSSEGDKASGVWGNGSASLARIARKGSIEPPRVKEPTKQSEQELWPTLGGQSSQQSNLPQTQKTQGTPSHARGLEPSHQPYPSSHVPTTQPPRQTVPLPQPSAAQQGVRHANPIVPQLSLASSDPKRKEAWSSTESSPRTPPLTPGDSPQRGCRKVEGFMVSPEAIESPQRVLQRWVDAGRPPVEVYARCVQHSELRALKRAVSVVAKGEAKSEDTQQGWGTGNPQQLHMRKRMRGEELIDHATALKLMLDLSKSRPCDVAPNIGGFSLTPPTLKPNNAVRCFEFKSIWSDGAMMFGVAAH